MWPFRQRLVIDPATRFAAELSDIRTLLGQCVDLLTVLGRHVSQLSDEVALVIQRVPEPEPEPQSGIEQWTERMLRGAADGCVGKGSPSARSDGAGVPPPA